MLNLLTALSLLICLAVCALWSLSYRRGVVGGRDFQTFTLWAYVNNGVVLFDACNVSPDPGPWRAFDSRTDAVTADSFPDGVNARGTYWFRACGFAAGRFDAGTLPATDSVLILPLWFVALVLGMPAWSWRRRRRRIGQCRRCGYDLRATPERCPECGTPAKAPA